jgi:cytochrome c oxidase assembly protein Cox11
MKSINKFKKALLICFSFSLFFPIIYFLQFPYNNFCQISKKCSGLNLSSFLPEFTGRENITINFKIKNNNRNLKIENIKSLQETKVGKKTSFNYNIENLSDQKISFWLNFFIENTEIEKYLKRYQCYCNKKYTLNPKEKIELKLIVKIDKEIEEAKVLSTLKDNQISLGYSIINN